LFWVAARAVGEERAYVPSALSGSEEETREGPAARMKKMRMTALEAIGTDGGGNDGGERRPRREEEEKSVGGEREAEGAGIEWLCFAAFSRVMQGCWGD
jgi:hypothetical protein